MKIREYEEKKKARLAAKYKEENELNKDSIYLSQFPTQ